MKKHTKLAPEQELTWQVLLKIGAGIKNLATTLFDLIKNQTLKLIYRKWIVFGTFKGKEIWDIVKNLNSHFYIKGETGFGKSSLAANIAIQCIEQEIRTVIIDPDGDPSAVEKGIVPKVWERVKDISKVSYLSTNQKEKIIGYNPLFLLAEAPVLDELKDELLDSIIFDSKESIARGHQVANAADFVFDSVIYFNNAYSYWLLSQKGKSVQQVKELIQTRQLTINDLASLDTNPKLIDLFIRLLGDQKNKYHRPDLVQGWEYIRNKKKFEQGMVGVVGRLRKVVVKNKAKLFFESSGFNIAEKLKNGKSVLCDISGLDEFSTAIVSRVIFVKVYQLHEKGILTDQTELIIDEAYNVDIPNLYLALARGRKKNLGIGVIYHFDDQFSDPRMKKSVRKIVVTKINFRNTEAAFNAPIEKIANLPKRHFMLENSKGVFEEVKTTEMPEIIRTINLPERGVGRDELIQRIRHKKTNITNFFLNI